MAASWPQPWDTGVVDPSPIDRAELQRAVERANAAIRAYLRTVPGGRLQEAHLEIYGPLRDAYNAAVAARDTRVQDAEEEPALAA